MRMRRGRVCPAVFIAFAMFLFLAAAPSTARADSIISVPQTRSVGNWGVPNTATYGQTVTVPVNGDTQLNSFTFYLGPPAYGSGTINYEAYVYAWDPTTNEATGSALYTSGLATYTPGAGYVPVTFSPGVNLIAGDQYVLFFSTSGLQFGQFDSTIAWGFNAGNAYVGGQFVFLNNGDNPAQWTTSPWAQLYITPGNDLEFNADFSAPTAAPEPGTALLLAMGLLGLLGFVELRRATPLA